MDLRASFWSALDWLRTLGKNPYFWGGMAVLFGIGFVAYLVVDTAIMPSYTRHDASISVPKVEKRPFEKAKTLLQERGLQVEHQVGRYNPSVDQGVVVDQTPLPSSKVKPGRRIYLTVNSGEVPMIQIPNLTGMSVREAKNRISSIGLKVGSVQKDPVPSPYPNTITKQDPAPGDSIEKGEFVALWYSTGLGNEKVEVPNVVGYSIENARDVLLKNELRSVVVDTNLTKSEESESPERELYIRQQGHSPDTSVRAGTEIRLFTTTDQTEAMERREALGNSTASTSD
jgi:beta-lactam-binding protein with PASTA domain